MTGEKAHGTLQRGVEIGKPVHDRRLRREDERHVGARAKRQRLALADEARQGRLSNSDDS